MAPATSGIKHVDSARSIGLGEAADPDPANPPDPGLLALEADPERAQRGGGGEHVGALEQPAHPAVADGHRAQQQGAVGQGLVPRDPGGAVQTGRRARAQLHRPPSIAAVA